MSHFFGFGHTLTWWQECNRAIAIVIFGLILIRLSGPRTFGKWGALDTIVSIIVGSNLSRALTGNAELGSTFAATALIFAIHWLMAQAVARSERLSHLLEGAPKVIVRDGTIDHGARLAQSISHNDIAEALREKNVESPKQTRLLIIEPSGKINVLPVQS